MKIKIIIAVVLLIVCSSIGYEVFILNKGIADIRAGEATLLQGENYIANATTTVLFRGIDSLAQNQGVIYQAIISNKK